MHHSKALAVLTALASHASARYISTSQLSVFNSPTPTQGQGIAHERRSPKYVGALPAGCVPPTPCQPGEPCETPKLLHCTGPADGTEFILPWEPNLIENVINSAGPSASLETQPPTVTVTVTAPAQTTVARAKRDDEQPTVYVFGDKTVTAAPQPSKVDNFVVEVSYVTDKKRSPVVPTSKVDNFVVEVSYVTDKKRSPVVPTSKVDNFLVEVSYVTDDKRSHVAPTVMPESDDHARAFIQDVTQEGVMVLPPTPSDLPTTLRRVRRQLRVSGPGFVTDPVKIDNDDNNNNNNNNSNNNDDNNKNDGKNDSENTSPPLRCYEWVGRGTGQGATAICTVGTLNEPQTHLFPGKKFTAVGKYAEYVCDPAASSNSKHGTTAGKAMIECRDRCGLCGGAAGPGLGVKCGEGCNGKREEETEEGHMLVFAGTDKRDGGVSGLWCPPATVLEKESCVGNGSERSRREYVEDTSVEDDSWAGGILDFLDFHF